MAVSICVLYTHAFLIKKQNMFIHQQWYNVELWHEVINKQISRCFQITGMLLLRFRDSKSVLPGLLRVFRSIVF